MAGVQDKPSKLISKQLRVKASEFLISRKNSNNLLDIINHFESGANQSSCILTLELIFVEVLKRRDMFQEIVPLKPTDNSPDVQYKIWLREVYDEIYMKILQCIENAKPSTQMQAFTTAMKLISWEGKYPLETTNNDYYFPVYRLKLVIMKLLTSEKNNSHILERFQEYSAYPDILYYTWRLLPPLTAKTHPDETYIMNFLLLLDKLQLPSDIKSLHYNPDVVFCYTDENNGFKFDTVSVRRSLNKVWSCVMHWDHTVATHKQLLIVLLERILSHLDKPLLLTDFLMDSLDMGGAVSLLALQGVFTMIQVYNLDYPNIFTKLYSMFEPEIFHTKFKARLFYLADLFLSSTHLPETLVAAYAKRLARLALVAPQEDIIIICMFIGNLILRHPGLKSLINHPSGGTASSDPYIMEERDPMKSNAILSSLWEIQTLQNHVVPNIATAARYINDPLPSVEWDLSKVLDSTSNDIFDKELRKRGKEIALTFDKPLGLALPKGDKTTQYWKLF